MGADRLTNMAAAVRVARAPMIIVDAGTATTFCVVDEGPAWIGGAIAPGAALSLNALCDTASKLPRISPLRPDTSFAKSTVDQMLSGACQGHEAMIEGLADRLVKDSGLPVNQMEYIATGGCLNFLSLSPRWRIMPDLTHYGLYVYGCLNE
jgi:type III pantothenate kinase